MARMLMIIWVLSCACYGAYAAHEDESFVSFFSGSFFALLSSGMIIGTIVGALMIVGVVG